MFMRMLICLQAERKHFYCKSGNLMSLLISVFIDFCHFIFSASFIHSNFLVSKLFFSSHNSENTLFIASKLMSSQRTIFIDVSLQAFHSNCNIITSPGRLIKYVE